MLRCRSMSGFNRGRSHVFWTALACAVALLTACGDDAERVPTMPTTTSMPGVSSPAVTSTLQPTASPTPEFAIYPWGTRTGEPSIDSVLETIETGDASAVVGIVRLAPEPCSTTEEGPGAVVRCPTGIPDGTLIDVLRGVICDSDYYREDHLDAFAAELLEGAGEGLTAVALIAESQGSRMRIIFAPSGPSYARIDIEDGYIVRYAWGCGPNESLVSSEDRFLLPPLHELQ